MAKGVVDLWRLSRSMRAVAQQSPLESSNIYGEHGLSSFPEKKQKQLFCLAKNHELRIVCEAGTCL
jgi:hypothetical protein